MSNIIKTCFGEEDALENRLVGSPEKKKDAVDGFIYIFTKNLFASGNNIDFLFDAESEELSKLFDTSHKEFFNVMMSEVAKIKKEKEIKTVPELETYLDVFAPQLRDNWSIAAQKSALYQEVIDFLKRNGLNTNLSLDDAELTETITKAETDEPTSQGLVIDPFDTDPTKVITNNIKLLCATIPQTEYKQGKKQFILNSFGFPKLVDSDFIKRTILNTVVGEQSLTNQFRKLDQRFYNKDLHEYNKGYEWIDTLKNRLSLNQQAKNMTTADLKLLVGFEVSFSKMLPELYKLVLSKDKPNYSYDPLEKDNNKDVTVFWNNNVISRINQAELFDKAQDTFFKHIPSNPNILTIDRNSKEYKDFTNSAQVTDKITKDNLAVVLEKLATLGIDFKRPLEEIYSNSTNARTIINSYKHLTDSLSKTNISGSPKITTFDGLFGDVSTGDIAKLTRVFNLLNPSDKNFSTRNAEGDSKYLLNDFSTAGLDAVGINNAQSLQELLDSRPDLKQQRYFNTERNRTVKILFDETGERYPGAFYKLVIVDGIGVEEVNEGKNTRNLSLSDSILQKFTNSLQGVYTLGINADKNTEWAIHLSKAYMQMIDTKSPVEIAKVFTEMLMDEMDAAMQDILIPSNIDFYQDNVWKLAYFREIVGIRNVRSFISDVLDIPLQNSDQDYKRWGIDRSKYDRVDDFKGEFNNYKARRDKWIETKYTQLADSFSRYIEQTVDRDLPKIKKALGIVKNAQKGFSIPSLDQRLVKDLLGSEADPTNLTESQLKDLVRFANINFEIGRNEQDKLHFGHPAYMKDPVKRYSMFLGVKRLMSKNQIVLQQMHRDLPRTDLRQDTISDSDKRQYIRKVTYAEPLFVVSPEELEEFAIHLHTEGKSDFEIGAKFNEDGSFKELVLNKENKPTGILSVFANIEGANSQEYLNYDGYWAYRQLIGDMSPEDWKLKEYDWAFEVYNLGTADPKSGYHFDYPPALIERAKEILEKYNNTVPEAPQGNFKPQFAGRSDKGNPVGLKLAGQYECWRTVRGTVRAKAYVEHKKKGIDFYGWESAEKFGNLTNPDGSVNHFYDAEGKFGNQIPPIQYLDPSGLGKQAEMPPHTDVKGTQKEKQVQADTHPDLIPIRTELNQVKSLRTTKAKEILLADSGLTPTEDGGYITSNPTGLINRLKRNLRRANVSDDQINALKVIKGQNDVYYINGISLDAHPSKDALERMLWSSVNREIVSPKQFGIPALITPELGIESDQNPVRFAYLDLETKRYVYVEDPKSVTPELRNRLQIVSKKGGFQKIVDGKVTPVEVIEPWQFGKFKNYSTGKNLHPRDLGLVQGKIKNEDGKIIDIGDDVWRDINNVQDPKIFRGIGWRIPTPDKSSISHLQGIGIYGPERGQIMTTSASENSRRNDDYDGDKLYTGYYNVRVVRSDFGSDKFKKFAIDYLNNAYEDFEDVEGYVDSWTIDSLKRLNHANWTERAAEKYENEAGSVEAMSKGNADIKADLTDMKKILQAYNAKYKENIILEPIDSEEDSIEGLDNKIFDLQWKLLEATVGYTSLMAPITLGEIPKLAQTIKDLTREQVNERDYTVIHQMIPSEEMRQSYIKFKDTIGILARAGTFHVMCNIAPINLTGTFNGRNLYFLYYPNRASANYENLKTLKIKDIFETNKNEKGQSFFGGENDVKGYNIGQTFTNFLQAALEVVKNNAIKDTGVNKLTAGQFAYLKEKGVATDELVFFLNQPIIKEYQSMWETDNSMQTKLTGYQKYRSGIALELLSKWWDSGKTYLAHDKAQSFYSKEALANFASFKKPVPPTKAEIKLKFYFELMSEFEQSKVLSAEDFKKHLVSTQDSSLELKKQQAILLIHYLQYEQQARQTFNLNRNINRDTANIGTFGEYALLSRLPEKIDNSGMFENSNAIFENTFVGGTKDAVDELSSELSKKFFISMDERLQPAMERLLDYIDNDDKFLMEQDKVKTINRFQNFLLNYLLQIIPDENGLSHYTKAQKLMQGASMPLRLSVLRKKYPDNIFLANMQPLIDQNLSSTSSMRLYKMNNNLHEINLITDSALVAYKSTGEDQQDLRDFFDDLAVYSMLQTGGQGNRNSIQKTIPFELWIKETAHLLEKIKNNPNIGLEDIGITEENLIRQFMQNNTTNIDLIPILGENSFDNDGQNKQNKFTNEINEDLISVQAFDPIVENDYIQRRTGNMTLLYEKINAQNQTKQVFFKRIPVLGVQGKHVEVYPEPTNKSIHKSNTPVLTTETQIENYLRDKFGYETVEPELVINEKNVVSLPVKNSERTNTIISRSNVRANPKTLFLFGDNVKRIGLGGQAKEMRGEPNTIGIITKYTPTRIESAYLSDKNLVQNQNLIKEDIDKAIVKWDSGDFNKLIIPQIGVGLAELPTRAPQTYEFLQSELQRLEDHVNKHPKISTEPIQVDVKPNDLGIYNIFAGSGENTVLSNLSKHPFIYNGGEFNSVEQAYQESKLSYTKGTVGDIAVHKQISENENPYEIKRLGRKYPTLDLKAWDENNSKLMEIFIKTALQQNPDFLQNLLATGNAKLTHTQDNTKWKTEFPRILMKLRDEFSGKSTTISKQASLFSDTELDNIIQKAKDSGEIQEGCK